MLEHNQAYIYAFRVLDGKPTTDMITVMGGTTTPTLQCSDCANTNSIECGILQLLVSHRASVYVYRKIKSTVLNFMLYQNPHYLTEFR